MRTQNKGNYTVSVAILIAGAFIAAAIFMSLKNDGATVVVPGVSAPEVAVGDVENVKSVTSNDHILGNPNAPVKLVEFSDTECPFCQRFHGVMQQVMQSDLGKSGKIAWVYRHFPLDALHSKARTEAQATECAAELGGNTGFWKYIDRIFEITPANNGLDLALLPEIAEYAGLDRKQFETCLASDKYANKIESQVQDAVASGGQGTPYSIVIAPNGKKFVVNGAQPYEAVKATLEAALNEK